MRSRLSDPRSLYEGACLPQRDVTPRCTGIEPEHVWYEKLTRVKVPHPHLVRFKHTSDVIPSTLYLTYSTRQGAQRRLAHRLACLFSSHGSLSQGHPHHRLVQEEPCRPLSEFTNPRHLVSVMLDPLAGSHFNHLPDPKLDPTACSSAFSDAGLFHGDASFGNTMTGLNNEGSN